MTTSDGHRVAIVDGVRTPFAKRNTVFRELTALDLGTSCVAELMHRTGLPGDELDRLIFGQVIVSMDAPNVAREVGLRAGLPPGVDAYSVSRACTTSYQTVVDAALAIQTGSIGVAIAGGTESASDIPVLASDELAHALEDLRDASSLRERTQALAGLRPHDLLPRTPRLAEATTGLTMGESAEKMAKENHISRAAQDELAHRSHVRAAAAWERGDFDDEVMHVHVPPNYDATVSRDNLVRPDSNLEAYARLKPVFDPDYGTLTAGNSSPLSDGASAVLLMSEERARDLGYEPRGFIRSHAFAAVDPREQLLIGPADATPPALERAGVRLGDLDLVDMHEAFSAAVLSVLQAFEERGIGTVDKDRLNVLGGSIALGHPFAATGTRQITQTLNELRRRGGGLALCTACAAGGLAASMVLETP